MSYKPVIKMASGGMVPKMPKVGAPGKAGASMAAKMPKPPQPAKPKGVPKLPGLPSMAGNKPKAMKDGGHVDEKADVNLIKKVVKPSALKGGLAMMDKKMTK